MARVLAELHQRGADGAVVFEPRDHFALQVVGLDVTAASAKNSALAAAVTDAGGLGLIASAPMSLAELEKAIEETAGRTAGPFGVNLRADAPDAAERVRLIVARRVPVVSFAQAPKPELIAALKNAGVITIASIGARRHAEKAAGWGIDAVIATGGEGGGPIRHAGRRATRRLHRAVCALHRRLCDPPGSVPVDRTISGQVHKPEMG